MGAILIYAIVVFNNATDFLRKLFSGEYWKKKVLAPDDCDDMSPLRESTDNASETTDEWDTSKKEIVMNSGKQADKSEEDEEETHTEDTSEEEEEENSVIPTDDKNDKEPGEVAFTVNRITEEELAKKRVNDLGDYDPTLDLAHYNMPTFDLLDQSSVNELTIDNEEQNANKQRIIETLNNYGIKISSIKATVGPTVTLYEIIPEPGVRIAKIRNLEDDIALSLSALGIRIIAPIPGKGTIGIEVPNKDAKIVSMYSVIASRKFQESKYDLPIGLGRTISNEVFMIDLAKMPHVLVAGTTGQG